MIAGQSGQLPPPIWPRALPRFGAAALFALNVWICWRLFFVEYSEHWGSVQSFFFTIAKGIRARWPDLGWWPVWNTGMPFEYTYQPLLHHLVALTAAMAGWSEARAYHFILALLISLGPVTLYALALRLTHRPGISFLAGLLHTFLSPSAILITRVAIDMDSWRHPRRVFAAVVWADAPNIVGLTLIPLAILLLHRALQRRTLMSWVAAAVALASVPLTNIPATIGLAMAVTAYALALPWRSWLRSWLQIGAASIAAWLLFAPWIPPSVLTRAASNVQRMNSEGQFSLEKLPYYVAFGVSLVLLCILLHWSRAALALRFAALFSLLTAFPALLSAWYGIDLIAQAGRFHIVMDLAIVLLIAMAIPQGLRWTKTWRNVLVVALLAVCGMQWYDHRELVRRITKHAQITNRSEYKIARWMEENAHGDRILAAGSTAFWMNYWTDTPQVGGCCDQSVLLPVIPMARYEIGTDDGAGSRAAEVSIDWFEVLGVHYVAVTGSDTTDTYRDWLHPQKFDGILQERWRDRDDVIYEVPLASSSLAHVVRPQELASRRPANGLDTEPMELYRKALLNQGRPQATFSWISSHEAVIQGTLPPGFVFSLQMPFHAGWHAEANGPVTIQQDALGFMTFAPPCSGVCEVHLSFDGGVERLVLRIVAMIAWGSLALLLVGPSFRKRFAPSKSGTDN
ncbi:MAG: hypothetical protein ABI811_04960 [Acidobacteriota bacterium]